MGILQASILECVALPSSRGIFSTQGLNQASILEWVATPSSRGIFSTQGLNPGFLHHRKILYQLSHQGSPFLHL